MVAREGGMGGMERMAFASMQQARAHRYKTLLATTGDSALADAARQGGFTVVAADFGWLQHTSNPLRLLQYAIALRKSGRTVASICKEHRVSIIHAHGPVAALYCVHAARKYHIPLLMHVHDAQTPRRTLAAVTRYVARSAARLVCVSKAVRETVERMGIPSTRTTVLYNGIDAAFFGTPPIPTPLVSGAGPHIALFASIVPWKGQHIFLEAAEKLADRLPAAHFYVVGGLAHPDDQPYLDRIRAMADAPLLQGRVTLTGPVANVPDWMAAMDVVAHTSVEREAFGLVIAEAMALGKRVVATDNGAPAEIIEDGKTGRLVPPNDPGALAGAIADLVSRAADDPMGVLAARSIRDRFTPERFGSELATLYTEVLNR
jgi:glycosyltransferase involved in cell wall biosynthesis